MSAQILVSAGIVGCSVIAGVFFTFSGFVMPALGRLPAPQGIAAMQAINVTASPNSNEEESPRKAKAKGKTQKVRKFAFDFRRFAF